MDEHMAQDALDDAAMRQGLLEFLWQFKKDSKGENAPPRPMPNVWSQDAFIKNELRRILFPKRKWWSFK